MRKRHVGHPAFSNPKKNVPAREGEAGTFLYLEQTGEANA